MAQWLSKKIVFVLLAILICELSNAQVVTGEPTRGAKDYKDPKQHEKFYKRRNIIGAWQINKLKQGALVVRLKTNKLAIDELNKAGNTKVGLEKELESFAVNKNTMIAFRDKYNFSKVYFIHSNMSDSLLQGARSGIFLDTNLNVDPSIRMTEDYYLIAERDYGYNSSIGFVPQDSARGVQETGNPVKQMAFVIKNKYGHQLKNPFPYAIGEKNFMDATYEFPAQVDATNGQNKITYYVDRTSLESLENQTGANKTNRTTKATANNVVKIQKQYTYEKLSQSVEQLNEELHRFHQASPAPSESSLSEDVKPFLY